MIDRFLDIIKARVIDPKFDQAQREAVIDLLVWTMFADHHVASAEEDRIDAEARRMAWDSPAPVEHYVGKAITATRAVLEDDTRAEAHLDGIALRLRDIQTQTQAYRACLRLANVDGEIAPEEKTLLRRVAHRFGLDKEGSA